MRPTGEAVCPGLSRGRWPGWQDKNLHSWPKAVLPPAHPSLPESWWHSGHRRGGYLVLSARKKLLDWSRHPAVSLCRSRPGCHDRGPTEGSPGVAQGRCPAPTFQHHSGRSREPQAQEEPNSGLRLTTCPPHHPCHHQEEAGTSRIQEPTAPGTGAWLPQGAGIPRPSPTLPPHSLGAAVLRTILALLAAPRRPRCRGGWE